MNKQYNHIYDLCKEHMHSYVMAEMVDGTTVDGIVTGLDEEYVYLAMPLEQGEHRGMPVGDPHDRQFGVAQTDGHGHYRYGGYPCFGCRPRMYRRLVSPSAALATLRL